MFRIKFTLALLCLNINLYHTHHYRGGTMYAKYKSGNSTVGTLIEITISFAWRLSEHYCDEQTIVNRELIGPTNDFIYTNTSILTRCETYCESYSQQEDWSFGKKTFVHRVPIGELSLIAYYESCCWLSLRVSNGLNWQLRAQFSTNNSSPMTLAYQPVVQLRSNMSIYMPIPYIDADDMDKVTCRWSKLNKSECGGICEQLLNATLNTNCTLTIPRLIHPGYYAIALQLDDTHSSTPLQFLIHIMDIHSITCMQPPYFHSLSSSSSFNSEYYGIITRRLFTYKFIATTQCLDTRIKSIKMATTSEITLQISPLKRHNDTSYYVDLNWTPIARDLGVHLICATAMDTSLQVAFHCISVLVGAQVPLLNETSVSPSGHLNYSSLTNTIIGHIEFKMTFDCLIDKPNFISFIKIYYHANGSLYNAIDVHSSKVNINGSTLFFRINNQIPNGTFYILFDYGLVRHRDYARLLSSTYNDPRLWVFHIDLKRLSPQFSRLSMYPQGAFDYNELASIIQDDFIFARVSLNRWINLNSNGYIKVYSLNNGILVDLINSSRIQVSRANMTILIDTERLITGNYCICIDEGLVVDFRVGHLFNSPMNCGTWSFSINITHNEPLFIDSSVSPHGPLTYDQLKVNTITWSIQVDKEIRLLDQQSVFIHIRRKSDGIALHSFDVSLDQITLESDKKTIKFVSNSSFANGSYFIEIEEAIGARPKVKSLKTKNFTNWSFNVDYDTLVPLFLSNTSIPRGVLTYDQLVVSSNNTLLWSIQATRPIFMSNPTRNISILHSNGSLSNILPFNLIINGSRLTFETTNNIPNGSYFIRIDRGIGYDQHVHYLLTKEANDSSFWSFSIDHDALEPQFLANTLSPSGQLTYTQLVSFDNTITWSIRADRPILSINSTKNILINCSNTTLYQLSSYDFNILNDSLSFNTSNFFPNGNCSISIERGMFADARVPFLLTKSFTNWSFSLDYDTLEPQFLADTLSPSGQLTYTQLIASNGSITWSIQADRPILNTNLTKNISIFCSNKLMYQLFAPDVTFFNNTLSFNTSNFFPNGNCNIVIDRGMCVDARVPFLLTKLFNNWSFSLNYEILSPSYLNQTAQPQGFLTYSYFVSINSSDHVQWSIQLTRPVVKCNDLPFASVRFEQENFTYYTLDGSNAQISFHQVTLLFNTNYSFIGKYQIIINYGLLCDLNLPWLKVSRLNGDWSFENSSNTLDLFFLANSQEPKGVLDYVTISTNDTIKWSIKIAKGFSNDISQRPLLLTSKSCYIRLVHANGTLLTSIDSTSSSLISFENDILTFLTTNHLPNGTYSITFDEGLVIDAQLPWIKSRTQSFWSFTIDHDLLAPKFIPNTASPQGTFNYSFIISCVNLTQINWSIRLSRAVRVCTLNASSLPSIYIWSSNNQTLVLNTSSELINNNTTLTFKTDFLFNGTFRVTIDDQFLCDAIVPWLKVKSTQWTFTNTTSALDLTFIGRDPRGLLGYSSLSAGGHTMIQWILTANRLFLPATNSKFIRFFNASNHTIHQVDILNSSTVISGNTLRFNTPNTLPQGTYSILFDDGLVIDPLLTYISSRPQSFTWNFIINHTSLAPVYRLNTARPRDLTTFDYPQNINLNVITWQISLDRAVRRCNHSNTTSPIRVLNASTSEHVLSIENDTISVLNSILTFKTNYSLVGRFSIQINGDFLCDLNIPWLRVSNLSTWTFDNSTLNLIFLSRTLTPSGKLTYDMLTSNRANQTLVAWSIRANRPILKASNSSSLIRILNASNLIVIELDVQSDLVLINDRNLTFFTTNVLPNGNFKIKIDKGFTIDAYESNIESEEFTNWSFNVDYDSLEPLFLSNTSIPRGVLTYDQLVALSDTLSWSIQATRPIFMSNPTRNISILHSNGSLSNILPFNLIINGSRLTFETTNNIPNGSYFIRIDRGIGYDQFLPYLLTKEANNSSFWSFSIDYTRLAPLFLNSSLDYSVNNSTRIIEWTINANRPIVKSTNEAYITFTCSNCIDLRLDVRWPNVTIRDNVTLVFETHLDSMFSHRTYSILFDRAIVHDAQLQFVPSMPINSTQFWRFNFTF